MYSFLLGLAIVYLGVLALLFVFQRNLMYFPDRARPDLTEAGAGSLLETVSYRSADGLDLAAWYRPPPTPEAAVLVHFHGNAGSIGDRVTRILPFADAGVGILLAEYRGFGGNSGTPTEQGLYADARAAIGFLQREGIAADRMVFYGESLGSGVAVQMATEQACGALVLEAPYSSVVDVAQDRYWMFPVRVLVKDRFDSTAKIGAVRCPVFIMHGDADRVIPIKFAERLYALAASPKEMKVYPGLGHVGFDEFRAFDAVLDFLRRHGIVHSAAGDAPRQVTAG
ncbi:MAG TPA: alpha/beta hydrolase [Dongiaceae bacterium]